MILFVTTYYLVYYTKVPSLLHKITLFETITNYLVCYTELPRLLHCLHGTSSSSKSSSERSSQKPSSICCQLDCYCYNFLWIILEYRNTWHLSEHLIKRNTSYAKLNTHLFVLTRELEGIVMPLKIWVSVISVCNDMHDWLRNNL